MMLSLVNLVLFTTILGGWVGWLKIENKVHLSPAEAEIGAELDNIIEGSVSNKFICQKHLAILHVPCYFSARNS